MNTPRPPRLALTRPTRISRLSRLALALLPALTLLQSSPAQAAVVRWVGADGEVWASPSNWSGGTLPGPLDEVQLGSFNTQITSNTVVGSVSGTGTLRLFSFGSNGLSLSGNSALGGLSLDGGSFNSSANTVISGQLQWRQGNISGSGLTRVSGAATLDLAGGGVLSGGHTLLLQGSSQVRTEGLNNFNALGISSNAHLVNAGSWLDLSRANTAFTNPIVGSLGHFDNQGSFTKATDTVTTFERGVQFNNSGSVHLAAGTLRIASDGSSSGSFHVAQGASLVFGPGAPVLNEVSTYTLGPALSSAGTVKIEHDSTLVAAQGLQLAGNTVVAGRLRLDSASSFADLSLSGLGSINQSAAQVVTGTLNWSGGGLNGPGSTRSTGVLQLGTPFKQLSGGHLLIAAGTTEQTVRGQIRMFDSARILNLGTWTDQANGDSFISGGRFDNEGVFNKTTNTRTVLGGSGGVFNNSGTVNLQAGTLHLSNSFNNQGLIQIASGATLQGDHASFANAGTLAGTGSIQALEALSNTGTLAPGGIGQRGQLSLLGALEHSGRLLLDIGSGGADLLAVSGAVTLGGTLQLAVASDQRLARGSQFTVLSWGERRNDSQFESLDFSQASGYRFATQYGANSLSLTVTGLPFTWTGAASGGFWDVMQNWNQGQNGLPQAGDTVLLGSADTRLRSVHSVGELSGTGRLQLDGGGQLLISGPGRIGGLDLQQGELSNSGQLVATGASSWTSTTLRGSGNTRIEGPLTIAGSDFDSTPILRSNHTLTLAGSTTFTGRRGLSVGDGGTLINEGSWIDLAPTDTTLGNFNGGSGRFLNQGSFTKASGTRTLIGEGTTLLFESTGTINVDAGYLRLSSSQVRSTGAVNIASGAELSLVSLDATLGGSVRNAGTLSLDGGVLTIAGDLAVQGEGLTRWTGLVHNEQVLQIAGRVEWGESTVRGSGSTLLNGPVLLVGDRSRGVLQGQTVTLTGSTTQVGTGGFSVGQGGRLRNLGNWQDAGSGNVSLGNFNGGVAGQFDNVGRFTKTSAFVTEIGNGLIFKNSGTLDIQAGMLRLSDSSDLTAGQIQIASGAMLDLARGSIALKGTVQNAGTLALRGATLVVADSATVQGGLVRLEGGGAIDNTGQLTLAGSVNWSQGDLRGSGSTRIEGELTLSGSSARQLRNGQTLELVGSTLQTGTGSLLAGNGARLINRGSWVEAANGNVFLGTNFGDPNRFDNLGRFSKTSAFVTVIGSGLQLDNSGSLEIQAGTLRFDESFNNRGLIELAAGAELQSTVLGFANAGTLAGSGTVRAADRLSNSGTLAAGGLDEAGSLSLLGRLTQQAGGVFLVDLGGTAAGEFDVLTISGTASLTGTLAVNLLAGAHFNVGDSFTVMSWGQRQDNSQFASLDLSQAGGYTFATEYGANSLTLRVTTAPVPEPGSWALLAAGLLGMAALRQRRHAEAQAGA